VINGYNRLVLPKSWGSGKHASADGTKWDLYERNLLSEYHIRYGGFGGIGYYHLSDLYIALFNHFIPCGAYEGVYILDPFYQNQSDIQPDTVHADTHGHTVTWTHASRRSTSGGHQARLSGRPERCRCGSTASTRTMVRSWSH